MPTSKHTKCCELWKKGKTMKGWVKIIHDLTSTREFSTLKTFPPRDLQEWSESAIAVVVIRQAHYNLWSSRVEARFTFHENNLPSKANVKIGFSFAVFADHKIKRIKSVIGLSRSSFKFANCSCSSVNCDDWWVFNCNDWDVFSVRQSSSCFKCLPIIGFFSELFTYMRASLYNHIICFVRGSMFLKAKRFCAEPSEWPSEAKGRFKN